MKKATKMLAALVAFVFMSSLALAQEKKDMKKHDGGMEKVMMKDGKMVVKKDGKESPMTSNMTMENGTEVMTDGTVKTSDGTTMKLTEGECVNMKGKIHDKNMKEKGMHKGEKEAHADKEHHKDTK
jgi:hypothetical protein